MQPFVLLLLAALPCWYTPYSVASVLGHHELRDAGNRWSMRGLTRYWRSGRGRSARPRAVNVLGLRGGYRDRDILRRYILVSSKSERNASSHDELRDLALTSGAAPDLHRSTRLAFSFPPSLFLVQTVLILLRADAAINRLNKMQSRSRRFGVFLWDKMQNSTGAEAMYKAALKQDPDYYPAMADLGCILHR